LTSDRPYRQRLSDDQAIDLLRTRRGTFYDPAVVEKFIELIPALRREDVEFFEHREAHASVLAGLARSTAGDTIGADRHAAMPAASDALPSIARALIDEQVGRLVDAEACLFELREDALVVAHATPRLRPAVAGLHVPLGSGVSGWVAANRSAIRHADPLLDIGATVNALGLQSCISVPVFVRADLFGVLTVYRRDAAESNELVDGVGLLAQEFGLAIARGEAGRKQTRASLSMVS
jgi:GAF domain-containing protein